MWGGRWEGGTFGELEGETAEELEPEEKLRLILRTRCKALKTNMLYGLLVNLWGKMERVQI